MTNLTRLTVTPYEDGLTWYLEVPFTYHSDRANITIVVPVGFMTNFASVPRILWSIFPPWGRYSNAAVLHDYLYATQLTGRKEADLLFKEVMEAYSVSSITVKLFYYAVRVFGVFTWDKVARKLKNGEARFSTISPKYMPYAQPDEVRSENVSR